MRARPAAEQRCERLGAGVEVCVRQADWQRHPEALAIAARVLGREPARLARDSSRHRSAVTLQRSQPFHLDAPRGRFSGAQVAQPDEQVMGLVGVVGVGLGVALLQRTTNVTVTRILAFLMLLAAARIAWEIRSPDVTEDPAMSGASSSRDAEP